MLFLVVATKFFYRIFLYCLVGAHLKNFLPACAATSPKNCLTREDMSSNSGGMYISCLRMSNSFGDFKFGDATKIRFPNIQKDHFKKLVLSVRQSKWKWKTKKKAFFYFFFSFLFWYFCFFFSFLRRVKFKLLFVFDFFLLNYSLFSAKISYLYALQVSNLSFYHAVQITSKK